jgi:PST family polysaccharide transporter
LFTRLRNFKINKTLIENFISLSFLQLLSFVLPLVTLPYLVQVLGVENYGTMIFIQTLIFNINVFIAYGFDMTITDIISKNITNKAFINTTFNAVIFSKILLLIIGWMFLWAYCFVFENKSDYYQLYHFMYLWVVGNAIFPQWFFQGIQKMKYITFVHLISKITFTLLIFITVHSEKDLPIAILCFSIGSLLAGITSLLVAYIKFNIAFIIPTFQNIKFVIKDGFYIFFSQAMVTIYLSSNVFFLKSFYGDISVGLYSIAYKIFDAIRMVTSPITQTTYPYFSNLFVKDIKEYKKKFMQLEIFSLLLFVLIGVIIFINADLLVFLISKSKNLIAINALKLFGIAAFLLPFGTIFTQKLIIQSQKKALFFVTIFACILNIIFAYFSVKYFNVNGAVSTIIFTLLFISIVKGVISYKQLNKLIISS